MNDTALDPAENAFGLIFSCRSIRSATWSTVIVATFLAGCSAHPEIEDVASPVRTEDIIRHARCEIRSAFLGWTIEKGIIAAGTDELKQIKIMTEAVKKVEDSRKPVKKKSPPGAEPPAPTELEKKISQYMGVGVAYDLEFDILEKNSAGGAIGLRIPFVSPAALDLGATAGLSMSRQGLRQFKAQDTLERLVTIDADFCSSTGPMRRRLFYPISGNIGVGSVTNTFLEIAEQGGGKDSFVETLKFTTEVGGGISAGLKLNPEPRHIRVVSASAAIDASRKDAHKIVISLAFPLRYSPPAITRQERGEGYLEAPFDRDTLWRARYNICVADARAREDKFNALRHEPPENSCIRYADSFAPTGKKDSPTTQIVIVQAPPAGKGGKSPTVRVSPPLPAKAPIRTFGDRRGDSR